VWDSWRGLDPARRLRLFGRRLRLDAAGRAGLVDLGIQRCELTWLRMKARAEQLGGGWARMWDEGVGTRSGAARRGCAPARRGPP
jgi:hypothetical protein